jgi:hypothetical protein
VLIGQPQMEQGVIAPPPVNLGVVAATPGNSVGYRPPQMGGQPPTNIHVQFLILFNFIFKKKKKIECF